MNHTTILSLVTAVLLTATLNVFATEEAPESTAKADKQNAYPLDTCVVSGMKLGSMGEPYVHKVGDQEVRFCCKGCLPRFEKDPAKYLKKLEPEVESEDNEQNKPDDHSGHHH